MNTRRHGLRSVTALARICNRLHHPGRRRSSGVIGMHVKQSPRSALVCAMVMLVGTIALAAQRATGDGPRALEGGWVRLDTTGSGSFGGLTATFARAVLTPEGAAKI